MAVEDRNYSSLNTVISSAIQAFDNIYDAIGSKSVPNYTPNGQGSAVSGYHTAIINYLFRVDGLTRSDINLDVIPNRSGATLSNNLTATSILYGESNAVTLSATGLVKAYYDTASPVNITMTGTPVAVSGTLTNNGFTAGQNDYTYTMDGKIVSSVTVAKANLSFSSNTLVASNDLAINNNDLSLTLPSTISGVYSADDYDNLDSPNASDYYTIGVGSTLTTAGTITTAIYGTLTTPGYVQAVGDVTVTQTTTPLGSGGLGLSGSLSSNIYIKKGSVSLGNSTGGALSITDNANISKPALESTDNADNFYEIQASVTAASFPDARITEGYITGGSLASELNVQAASDHVFIKKGSVTGTSKAIDLNATSSDISVLDYSDTDKVTINVAVSDMTKSTVTVSPGYITSTGVDVTYTGGTKTISIRKAGGSLTASSVDAVISGTPIVAGENLSASEYYAISSSISGSLSIDGSNSHLGYLANTNDFSGTFSNATGSTYYVKKGVDADGTLTLTSELLNNGTYRITGTARHTTALGYYEAASARSWTETTDIPAATMRWVEGTNDTEGYFEIATGGYLPAGKTFVFGGGGYDEPSGGTGESLAQVKATLTNSTVLSTGSTVPSGAYEITISKDATTDAGYISSAKGTLGFAGGLKYYVAKGQYTRAVTSSATINTTPRWDTSSGKWMIAATPTISAPAATVADPGYINPATDISITATAGENVEAELAMGQIGASIGAVTFEENDSGTTVQTTTGTSSYQISVGITADVTPTVTRAGYVSNEHKDSTPGQVTGSGVFKIKPGSVSTTVLTGSFTPQFDPSTLKVSVQKTSLSGTTTITEGYVSSGTVGIAASQPNLSLGEITLNAAAATLTASSNIKTFTAASDVELVTAAASGKSLDANYYAITVTPQSSSGITISQDGYIKDSTKGTQVNTVTNQEGTAATRYIEKFIGTGSTGSANSGKTSTYTREGASSSETVWKYNIGAAADGYGELFIDTKKKYSAYAILVDLDDNAAGTNVLNDLDRLSLRLDGQLARSGS